MREHRFADSFISEIRVKKEPCMLKYHYRNCARQAISRIEYLASLNSDRFVWEAIPNLTKHCINRKTQEPYSQRIVEYALSGLRQQGVISDRHIRTYNGVERSGFTVITHDSCSKTNGKQCALSPKRTAQNTPPPSPPHRHPIGVLCGTECGSECGERCGTECGAN
jgi:hypothetical protein